MTKPKADKKTPRQLADDRMRQTARDPVGFEDYQPGKIKRVDVRLVNRGTDEKPNWWVQMRPLNKPDESFSIGIPATMCEVSLWLMLVETQNALKQLQQE